MFNLSRKPALFINIHRANKLASIIRGKGLKAKVRVFSERNPDLTVDHGFAVIVHGPQGFAGFAS